MVVSHCPCLLLCCRSDGVKRDNIQADIAGVIWDFIAQNHKLQEQRACVDKSKKRIQINADKHFPY